MLYSAPFSLPPPSWASAGSSSLPLACAVFRGVCARVVVVLFGVHSPRLSVLLLSSLRAVLFLWVWGRLSLVFPMVFLVVFPFRILRFSEFSCLSSVVSLCGSLLFQPLAIGHRPSSSLSRL